MNRGTIRTVVVCLALATLGAPAWAGVKAPEAEKAAIAKVIDGSIGWFKNKDFDLCFGVLADDPDLFMFQPAWGSTIHGIEQMREHSAVWRDPANRYVSHDIRDLRIHLHPSGEVAWFSAILEDCGEYSGRVGCWKDTRWTGILEKREERWVLMQMHFSFASDKVVAAAQETLQTAGAGARQAALDYAEGWYEGDAARVERVLHPEFVRRIAAVTVAGDDFFWHQDRAQLLEATRRGGDNATPADRRQIKATVRDLFRTTATVRVDSTYYVEYLSLVKLRDTWQVVNVLWENVPNDKKEEVAVDPKILARYAGTYRNEAGVDWQVIVEGNRIFLKPPTEPRIEVFAEAETEFFTKGYKSGVTFVRDAAGKVARLVKHVNYRDLAFERIDDQ